MTLCTCWPCDCPDGWDCRGTGIVEPSPTCPHHADLWRLYRSCLAAPYDIAVFVPRADPAAVDRMFV